MDLKAKISELGFRLQENKAERHPEISLTIARSYTNADLDAFHYFQVFPQLPIAETSKLTGTTPQLQSKSDIETEGKSFGFLSPYWWMLGCDPKGKNLIESSHFEGLRLVKLQDTPAGIWLVWSNFKMGPIENDCFDNSGNTFSSQKAIGHNADGCLPMEGCFGIPHLKYREKSVAGVDVALTKERFSPSSKYPCWPSLIVSSRVRMIIKNDPSIGFIPVEVE